MLYIYTLYFSYGRRCSRVCETEKMEKQALKLFFIYKNIFLFYKHHDFLYAGPRRVGPGYRQARQGQVDGAGCHSGTISGV
jgi:hypothetical protein